MTIFLIVFIDLLGFGIILPLLPYIGEKYGANPLVIGFLTASYSFFQFVASPILGKLSDRYGRKKILIISQLGSAFGYVLLGVAGSLPLLFLSRIIDGITGGNISIAQAYIRAKGMGLIGAAFGLGFIFGPAIGGALSKFGYIYPALFATVISLISVIMTAFFLKETVNVKKTIHSKDEKLALFEFKKFINFYPINLYILIFFVLNLAFSLFQGNFALWAERALGLGPTHNGLLFSYMGILIVITQLKILPVMIKKYKEKMLLKIGVILLAVGLFSLVGVNSILFLYITFIFIALGNGLVNPAIQALASENVKPEEYGGVLGILQSAGSLGRIIGPIVGGELFFVLGKSSPFIASSVVVFGAAVIVFLMKA